MKWARLLVCLIISLPLLAGSPYGDRPRDYSPPGSVSHSSFMYTVDIARLANKCANGAPAWMVTRIHKELSIFRQKKVSVDSLSVTHEKFAKAAPLGTRYRFINGFIYRKGPDPYGMDDFFRTLGRLADYPGIPDLPNVDFIWNHDDATPIDHQSRNFWITEDFANQAPIFTYAVKKGCPYLVSIPDRFTIPTWASLSKSILEANHVFPWQSKQKVAFWRGQCNDFGRLGLGFADYETVFEHYTAMARYQVCLQSSLHPEYVNAGFNGFGFATNENLEKVARPFFTQSVSPGEHLNFAYLPVLDGYTATYPGYLWRLLSNSVAFKQDSEDSQWFYDALEPYIHYVPVENRMENLIAQIQWARENDELCQQIGVNATEFALNNLMIEDVYLYFFLLFNTYKECLGFDASDFLEATESDPAWIRIR